MTAIFLARLIFVMTQKLWQDWMIWKRSPYLWSKDRS